MSLFGCPPQHLLHLFAPYSLLHTTCAAWLRKRIHFAKTCETRIGNHFFRKKSISCITKILCSTCLFPCGMHQLQTHFHFLSTCGIMSWNLGALKADKVSEHIDAICEQETRAISLRNHHSRATAVSLKTAQALKQLSDVEKYKTPTELLASMQQFQSMLLMNADTNGIHSSHDEDHDTDFDYLKKLYIIKASATMQHLFIDTLTQLYQTTQQYLEFWNYENANPIHYAITHMFWRTKQLHQLITFVFVCTCARVYV